MSSENSNKQSFFGFLLWAYGIVSQIMALYYWIQYVKEDNFFIAITLDVLLAELKGLLWIFFVW